MALMLHPNTESPERYRVYNQALKIQQYFSIKKHGQAKALELATALEAEIQKKVHHRKLREELSINKLFIRSLGPKGEEVVKIKGLQRKIIVNKRRADTEALTIQVSVAAYTSKHICVHITDKCNFEQAYKTIQERLLAIHEIERTLEISQMFKQAKRNYWQDLK